jgi:hypothetical protein
MVPYNMKDGLDFWHGTEYHQHGIDEERQGASQVATLGRQLFLGRWKVLTVSYTDVIFLPDRGRLSTFRIQI